MEPPVRRFERDRDALGRAENQRPRDRFGRPLPRDAVGEARASPPQYDDLDEALAHGVELWDAQRYFEAHEALETVWHAAPEPERDFWQGVIQVAVGCVHHQRGNAVGAMKLWRRAAERLDGYPDVHHGVDVEQLRVFALGAAAAVEEAGMTVEVGYPEFPAMDGGPWVDDPRPEIVEP